jgi:hypothetical protein
LWIVQEIANLAMHRDEKRHLDLLSVVKRRKNKTLANNSVVVLMWWVFSRDDISAAAGEEGMRMEGWSSKWWTFCFKVAISESIKSSRDIIISRHFLRLRSADFHDFDFFLSCFIPEYTPTATLSRVERKLDEKKKKNSNENVFDLVVSWSLWWVRDKEQTQDDTQQLPAHQQQNSKKSSLHKAKERKATQRKRERNHHP